MMNRLYFLALLFFALMGQAYAACSTPDAEAGEIIYNGTYNLAQYCDGSVWVNMGISNTLAGSGGCSSPDGEEGEMIYNGSEDVYQFCNGEDWINTACTWDTGGSGGCSSPDGEEGELIFNSSESKMQFCDGDDWFNAGSMCAPVLSTYGTDMADPGLSCADILLRRGSPQPDGTYWVDEGSGATEVYCDMTTGSGGLMIYFTDNWTDFKNRNSNVPQCQADVLTDDCFTNRHGAQTAIYRIKSGTLQLYNGSGSWSGSIGYTYPYNGGNCASNYYCPGNNNSKCLFGNGGPSECCGGAMKNACLN